jgi:hypothetical protein
MWRTWWVQVGRFVYARLRNALSRRRASVECAGRWFTSDGAPPASDAVRRGAALNLRPEKDATPVNPAQLMFTTLIGAINWLIAMGSGRQRSPVARRSGQVRRRKVSSCIVRCTRRWYQNVWLKCSSTSIYVYLDRFLAKISLIFNNYKNYSLIRMW